MTSINSATAITSAIRDRILLIDGAMGTAIQSLNLTADDYGGDAYDGCNEHLVLTRPDVIQQIHDSYLNAGADIIQTNTFGGTPMVLDEFDLGHKADEINRAAVRLAKKACATYSTNEQPRFVAGSIGPTTKSLSVTGGITFEELSHEFYQQAKSLTDEGVDYILIETSLDTLNIKAALIGVWKAFEELETTLPIAISGTIETMGTMLAGQSIEALYTSIEHINPLYIGLNCATGPAFMIDHLRTLAEISRFPVAVVPNAGIPDEHGIYPEGPRELMMAIKRFEESGWVNVIGGCCGTTYDHINALRNGIDFQSPRPLVQKQEKRVSGIETLIMNPEDGPYIIGERTNVIGSRAFKQLIADEKFEEAAEIARKQVKAGAHIIDVCLSNPDRDEVTDIIQFLEIAVKLVKVPFMIDSQRPDVVEAAFRLTQGKCILNSINLEEGETAFEELVPLVKTYGAMVVVGCIQDEMAITAERKLAVAQFSRDLLVNKYGLTDENIMFDPLVFPCGTGDENYFGSGRATIEGVRSIKEHFPNCLTTLGISNVSFGLPPAGREILNSVFLYECVQAGLDTAIVNSEKLVRYAIITDEEKQLCMDLLDYDTTNGNDPIANFVTYFRDKQVQEKPTVDRSQLTIEQKLEINIVEGTKEYLHDNLDEALQVWEPLEVINQPLMKAMDIVGTMFGNNELIVAEVLQSAESMKAAVAYLEQFMNQTDIEVRGTMVLATVKGDVHDIGKNLVQIILGNNGYKIIDLGIKCPPDKLLEAVQTHQPNLIGLSGLLVKSAQQMVSTVQDLKQAGITVPVLIGGAALTERFVATKIAPEYDGVVVYCKDAMSGLDVSNKLMNPDTCQTFIEEVKESQMAISQTADPKKASPKRIYKEKINLSFDTIQAKAPHFSPVVNDQHDIETIWNYINPQMLYGNHMGLKGNVVRLLEKQDKKAVELKGRLDMLKNRIVDEKLLKPRAIYQFFKVRVSDNAVIILDHKTEKEQTRFVFPRQRDGLQLCLTEFLNPNEIDSICFFVVTCGHGVADVAKKLMDEGNYFDSHGLSALALESAEGYAEYIHQLIRSNWGIPDPKTIKPDDMFKTKYTGKRFSFGYPACPRLEDQALLWDLMPIKQRIGVDLSDEYMMSPEASVSAMVFHHPEARYFSINQEDLDQFIRHID